MIDRLEILTFDDLKTRIEGAGEAATGEAQIRGWAKLNEVVIDLGGKTATEANLLAQKRWALTRVKISGYQGISSTTPLEFSLSPSPGITVIQGLNGAGKSSIADAIDSALRGAPRQHFRSLGTGGREELWARDHCGRHESQALVEVELAHNSEIVTLKLKLDTTGAPSRWDVAHSSYGVTTTVDLDETPWRSWLAIFSPVFAYATVERQVQQAKDLKDFLEPLLAFGGCFAELEAAVATKADTAKKANAAFELALKQARSNVEAIDQRWDPRGEGGLADIGWPKITDDPDDWATHEGLLKQGHQVPEIASEHKIRIKAAVAAMKSSLTQIRNTKRSVQSLLALQLKELSREAQLIDGPGQCCPVCSTKDVDWLQRLLDATDGDTPLEEQEETAFITALGQLKSVVEIDLRDIRACLEHADVDKEPKWRLTVDAFAAVLDLEGLRPVAAVRDGATNLIDWLESPDFEQVFDAAVERSDKLTQWQLARSGAIAHLLGTWIAERDAGSEWPDWEQAGKCIPKLQERLREERGAVLSRLTSEKVEKLLEDTGIEFGELKVQGTKASLAIADSNGREVSLSMLSAGQRNALLLAPLLAAATGGPFAFTIIDDPVHAFDELRVDRLAEIINSLALDRRVIILTHDNRLQETLLAKSLNSDRRQVKRNPQTGIVSVEKRRQLWEQLVEDARSVFLTARDYSGGTRLSPDDLVRGLCRQAIDNALREFVVLSARVQGADSQAATARLDRYSTTSQRLAGTQMEYVQGSTEHRMLDEVRAIISPYEQSWNAASHGNISTSLTSLQEITAASHACAKLVAP